MPAGTRLGPYEVLGAIGAGGMGEVYKARDTRLNRDVALKILPEALSNDPDRLMRFEREAQALAALNHPNIGQVYDVGRQTDAAPGALFIVMEFVEGDDLSARMARGPIPLDEALPIARQIADGLEAAHEAGVIHRDLKPANIRIRADGSVKLLDFGLAKALDPDGGRPDGVGRNEGPSSRQDQPTVTSPAMTAMGIILGTAAYMSPEQAKGSPVDKRADVWAFGVVLYEMLTGTRLFDAPSMAETLAQVLTRLVDVAKLPPETPLRLRWLIKRLLERNPKNRLHDMADARIVLDELMAGDDDVVAAPAAAAGIQATWVVAAGAAVLGFAAATLYFGFVSEPGTETAAALRAPAEFEIAAPAETSLVPGLALSRDGRMVAFVARGATGRAALWVRSLESIEPRELAGTEDARYPFWAPDNRRIGFFAQGRLKTADILGGLPLSIADAGAPPDARGGAWNGGDVILFAPTFTGPLRAVDAGGGDVREATALPDGQGGTHRFPSFLPDGQRFLFYASEGTGLEPGTIRLGRIGSLESKPLGRSNSAALFVVPDLVLYVQGDSLVAHRWDDEREALVDEPIPLGVTLPGGISVSGLRSLDASSSGVLVYRVDKRYASRLVWVDRAGREVEELSKGEEIWHYSPRISPDGRRVAVSQYGTDTTGGSVWVHDLARGISTRITGDEGDESALTWSPDGRTIAYSSIRSAPPSGIYLVDPDRPGQGRVWVDDATSFPVSWTPDGTSVFFYRTQAAGRPSLWVKPTGSDGDARRIDSGFATEGTPEVSADGRWMAYTSDATRRTEVYVRAVADEASAAVRISREGGSQPGWSRDGSELFYVDDAGRLVAVSFESLDPLTPGPAVALFTAGLEESIDRQWDISPDGRRFLLNRTIIGDTAPITVVLGWRQRIAELISR